jgi:hypothetical protein
LLDFKSLYSYLFENSIINDKNDEIDKLLNFCKKFFVNNDSQVRLK